MGKAIIVVVPARICSTAAILQLGWSLITLSEPLNTDVRKS